jgi:hypothetical protein
MRSTASPIKRTVANGNNLVGLANPGELLEVDKAGKVGRSIAGKKMDIEWMGDGDTALPDGGLLVADYTGKRLLEIDASGRVVHQMRTTGTLPASHWFRDDEWIASNSP